MISSPVLAFAAQAGPAIGILQKTRYGRDVDLVLNESQGYRVVIRVANSARMTSVRVAGICGD